MTDATSPSQGAAERRDALVERLFGAVIAAGDVLAVYIGDQLGLYRALAEHGPRHLATRRPRRTSTSATCVSGSSSRLPAASSTRFHKGPQRGRPVLARAQCDGSRAAAQVVELVRGPSSA